FVMSVPFVIGNRVAQPFRREPAASAAPPVAPRNSIPINASTRLQLNHKFIIGRRSHALGVQHVHFRLPWHAQHHTAGPPLPHPPGEAGRGPRQNRLTPLPPPPGVAARGAVVARHPAHPVQSLPPLACRPAELDERDLFKELPQDLDAVATLTALAPRLDERPV